MNFRSFLIGLVAVAFLAAAGYGIYTAGLQRGLQMAPEQGVSQAGAPDTGATVSPTSTAAPVPQSAAEGEEATRRHIASGLKAGDVDPATGKKILYYHDPMVPGKRFDKPAKSPFMDMMLAPMYADSGGDASSVTVSSRTQQNLGVRTAPVTEGSLSTQVSAIGNIAFNERDQVVVQARATGYVERLHVRATLDRVSKGQPLADLYVPDWIAAQEEFLSLRRMQGGELAPLIDGARQRMRQVGMNAAQIGMVESSGRTQPRITLTAPIAGVVTELMVREGMTVMSGATLFQINGLSSVWANAEVPESQSALLRPGVKVQARSPAAPGTIFDGKVQAILPEVDPATRTLKVRLELANPGFQLVPGMFVQMQFTDKREAKTPLVPTEAVIQTGRRTVVLLAEENGRFRPVDVEIGIESGGQTEVTRGLQAGQRVVVSSQFLIDSEASLRGVEARLNAAPQPDAASTAPSHRGEAKVEAIGSDSVTLSHDPIDSLKWGAMTMDFKLPRVGLTPALAPGDRVSFEFYMDAEGLPRLTGASPLAPQPAARSAASRARPAGTKP